MENQVRAICRAEGLNAREITPLSGGQVNRVFLVDGQYVVRIGQRADASLRLERENAILRALAGQIPVPRVYAFGRQDDQVYQIQQFLPGEKLYRVWNRLAPRQQDRIAAELAAYLSVLHRPVSTGFGNSLPGESPFPTWQDYVTAEFERVLREIHTLNLRMFPGVIDMARAYFTEYSHVLADGSPALVHGDLSMVNILIHQGGVSAILDFEYALNAPPDYELRVIEAYCLYPNDWAEEGHEVFCAADFAGFIPLLRKHDPDLFAVPFLRRRLDLYHLLGALSDYLAWRKDNLAAIPPERMAAKEFYLARISNFIFDHGIRLV